MMYLVFGKGGWGQLPHWLCWPTRKNNAISLRFSIWGSIQSASPSHNNAVNEQKCPKNKIGITSEAAIPVKKQGVGGNSSLKAKRKSRHHRMQKQHTSQVKYEQCLSSCLKEHEIKAKVMSTWVCKCSCSAFEDTNARRALENHRARLDIQFLLRDFPTKKPARTRMMSSSEQAKKRRSKQALSVHSSQNYRKNEKIGK